jgi:uncharacterized protein YndB with AHSA1/START domain
VTALRIERTLPAPRERVWRAFTDGASLAAWFWPAAFGTTAHVDARPGGELRIAATNGLAVSGRFSTVEAPRLLVFTWRWDGDDEQTVVTIELSEIDGGTGLVLTHDGFATDATRDDHVTGWSDCLDRLPAWLAAAATRQAAPRV